jgi:hypothetical protein
MACSLSQKDYEFFVLQNHRGPGCPETYFLTILDDELQNSDDYVYTMTINFDPTFVCSEPSDNPWVAPDSECWVTPDGDVWVAT